jgi:hypothetical protein
MLGVQEAFSLRLFEQMSGVLVKDLEVGQFVFMKQLQQFFQVWWITDDIVVVKPI